MNLIRIQVEGIKKSYGRRLVLDGVSFSASSGECILLSGSNGSGKSTFLKILSGILKPDSITNFEINGEKILDSSLSFKKDIGYCAHQPMLYPDLSAKENLIFFCRLYHVSQTDKVVTNWLKKANLYSYADDPLRTFSRGMIQRTAIIRSLIHQPSILLFDEPFTGLDQTGKTFLSDIICSEKEKGSSIIITTHNFEELNNIATRNVEMLKGILYEKVLIKTGK